jgi:hypothetical protein
MFKSDVERAADDSYYPHVLNANSTTDAETVFGALQDCQAAEHHESLSGGCTFFVCASFTPRSPSFVLCAGSGFIYDFVSSHPGGSRRGRILRRTRVRLRRARAPAAAAPPFVPPCRYVFCLGLRGSSSRVRFSIDSIPSWHLYRICGPFHDAARVWYPCLLANGGGGKHKYFIPASRAPASQPRSAAAASAHRRILLSFSFRAFHGLLYPEPCA